MFYDLFSTEIRMKTSLQRVPNPVSAACRFKVCFQLGDTSFLAAGWPRFGVGPSYDACYPREEQLEFPRLLRAKPQAGRMCCMCAH